MRINADRIRSEIRDQKSGKAVFQIRVIRLNPRGISTADINSCSLAKAGDVIMTLLSVSI
jgi:hypothetical protein